MCRSFLAALVCAFPLTACQQPTIDGSSDDAFEESIQEVRASLPTERQAALDAALMVIGMDGLDLGTLFSQAASGVPTDPVGGLRERLDGRTATEVLEMYDSVQAVAKERAREQALQEIAELREQREASDAAKVGLADIEVTRSRFYLREQQFGGPEPIIELTVHNGTEHAVSRAYFQGRLATPGRSVAWLDESFNYSVSGGLEPGETASWSLAPNMFSEWGRVGSIPGAVFTVTVVRVDGADGEALFHVDFDEDDQERLDELEREWGG